MIFEWDESKNRINFRKHGIRFEEAQTIWADYSAIEFFDDVHSSTEDRFFKIGRSIYSNLLFVSFCERNKTNSIRIISARKATYKERDQYEEGI